MEAMPIERKGKETIQIQDSKREKAFRNSGGISREGRQANRH
jgi:hypothetical protein